MDRKTARLLALSFGGALTALASGCAGTAPVPPVRPEREIVMVGYGTQEREDVTGAVSSLLAEDFPNPSVRSVEELLVGRVPGLQVIRRPDGNFSLRIRGVTSFMGNNEPLVVIDGMPIHTGGLMSAFFGLSPHDVARIDVLRDAASTAIYGSRGANGVILITTKRPR
jgi:TonB-dependent SusC/RagA subfamily outer membrane receptor